MRGKENTYASEFHKLLVTSHKDAVMGCKTHGGPFQKTGFPDYLYWWNRKRDEPRDDEHDFMAIEFKYIWGKKVPKKLFRPESHLRPEQRRFLIRLNDFGYLAVQATFIEYTPRNRIIVFNRVWANGDAIEIDANVLRWFAETKSSDRNERIAGTESFNYFLAHRSSSKPHYPWPRIIDGLRRLV